MSKQSTRKKVPVGERTLICRVNRRLALEFQHLHASRPGTRAESFLGAYYIVSTECDGPGQMVVADHLDLVTVAKELRCFQPFEELVDESQAAPRRAAASVQAEAA